MSYTRPVPNYSRRKGASRMYERFTDRGRKVMQLANREAQRFNHEYIGTEHILLGLVKEGSGVAAQVLKNLDIDLSKIRLEVEKIVQSGPDAVSMGKLPLTPRAKKVIEYAIEEARALNHSHVGTEHLLLGLLREEEAVAAQVLLNLGLRLGDVRKETLNVLKTDDPGRTDDATQSTSAKASTLDRFGIDLIELARVGKLDPVVGRHEELERLLLILGCRTRHNPLLVGADGVGKNSIVDLLAWFLAGPDCPERLRNRRLIELDLDRLVLETIGHVHLEQTLRDLIKELLGTKNVILYLGDITPLLVSDGLPPWQYACQAIKAALAQGEVQCIATASPHRHQLLVARDGIARQFQSILVQPPPREDTLAILRSLREQYEAHHRVQFDDEALEAAIDLSEQYLPEQCLPGRAIRLLDQAGSLLRLQKTPRQPASIQALKTQIAQLREDVEEAVAEQDFDQAVRFRDLRDKLKKQLEETERDWQNQQVEVIGRVERATMAEVVRKMTGKRSI